MAKERLKTPRARLFIALDLPENVLETLARWLARELAGDPSFRLVPPSNMHVTLVFLGYKPLSDVERIASVAFGGQGGADGDRDGSAGIPAMPAGALSLAETRAIPPRGRPRLLAVEVNDEGRWLERMQGVIEHRLTAAGIHQPEKRPFWPHVTVARLRNRKGRRDGGDGRPTVPFGGSAPQMPESLRTPFAPVRMTLYRSVARFAGTRYESQAHLEINVATSGVEIDG